ncbi:unnamed protein product [Polarella glacialis]|uniref:Protein SirB1 N-terminal domain-containing protein n=1 Tax=Polarella glacialis TaxID=89957 RepID=A0A813DQS9_POLGL|nr:unnamed protein product [Polarella glacialis]CAE8590264.1 unnamed protein product [Polarella glacialis]
MSAALRWAFDSFEEEVSKPDADIDLTRAFALLALHAQPDLDLERSIFEPLERLCSGFRQRVSTLDSITGELSGARRLESRAAALCSYLTAEGFQGCGRGEDEFYLADNSLLNRLLERRTGIPISLAVVYRHVGLAGGLQLWGANFPGYFMMGYGEGTEAGLLDAFTGRTASANEAAEVLGQIFGFPVRLEPGWSSAPSLPNLVFLQRIVRNLQNVYDKNGSLSQAARLAQYGQLLGPLVDRALR